METDIRDTLEFALIMRALKFFFDDLIQFGIVQSEDVFFILSWLFQADHLLKLWNFLECRLSGLCGWKGVISGSL